MSATIRARGHNPISIACRVSEKTPEMSDCEAMMVASAASTTIGIKSQPGANL